MEQKAITKISVLMPVFNCREYIEESVKSIIDQTYSDFELLIIDDCSTDGTYEYLKSLEDNRITIVRKQQNTGLTISLNMGLRMAKGEYIARMDGDDISLPLRFEKQIKFMSDNPDIGLCGTWFEYYPTGISIKSPIQHNEIYAQLFKYSAIAHPTVMLRRKVISENNCFYNPEFKHAEDYELWSRLIKITRVANIPEVLLLYRVHADQISYNSNKVQLASATQVKINLYKNLIFHNVDEFHDVLIKMEVSDLEIINDEFNVMLNAFNEAYITTKRLNYIDSCLFLKVHISLVKKALFRTNNPSPSLLLSFLFSRLFWDAKIRDKASVSFNFLKAVVMHLRKG